MEHCATPMNPECIEFEPCSDSGYLEMDNCYNHPGTWQEGISHADRGGNLWSGNFKGWIQYRKLIKGENYDNGTESC